MRRFPRKPESVVFSPEAAISAVLKDPQPLADGLLSYGKHPLKLAYAAHRALSTAGFVSFAHGIASLDETVMVVAGLGPEGGPLAATAAVIDRSRPGRQLCRRAAGVAYEVAIEPAFRTVPPTLPSEMEPLERSLEENPDLRRAIVESLAGSDPHHSKTIAILCNRLAVDSVAAAKTPVPVEHSRLLLGLAMELADTPPGHALKSARPSLTEAEIGACLLGLFWLPRFRRMHKRAERLALALVLVSNTTRLAQSESATNPGTQEVEHHRKRPARESVLGLIAAAGGGWALVEQGSDLFPFLKDAGIAGAILAAGLFLLADRRGPTERST